MDERNAFFIYFGMSGHHLPHPRRSLYTPPVETPAPQHPSAPGRPAHHRQQHRPCQMQDRPCKARHTRPDAGHAAPVCTRCQTGHAETIGQRAVCWRVGSVSETVQICTHSNMNDFQHKNVCKTVDINTRTCYYIDNTRTCYTTTKQGDKKP